MKKRQPATTYRGLKKLSQKAQERNKRKVNDLLNQCFGGSNDSKNI
jgi:hypothetical protein